MPGPPLRAPDAWFVDDIGSGPSSERAVALVWGGRKDLPPARKGVSVLVTETPGKVEPGFAQKLIPPGAHVLSITVNGAPGALDHRQAACARVERRRRLPAAEAPTGRQRPRLESRGPAPADRGGAHARRGTAARCVVRLRSVAGTGATAAVYPLHACSTERPRSPVPARARRARGRVGLAGGRGRARAARAGRRRSDARGRCDRARAAQPAGGSPLGRRQDAAQRQGAGRQHARPPPRRRVGQDPREAHDPGRVGLPASLRGRHARGRGRARSRRWRWSRPIARTAITAAARPRASPCCPRRLAGRLQVLELHGNFGVDAFAPDGQYLYLIQHLQGEHYKVRAYDLMAAQARPADGRRQARAERADGGPAAARAPRTRPEPSC